jgi:hypothetical protein
MVSPSGDGSGMDAGTSCPFLSATLGSDPGGWDQLHVPHTHAACGVLIPAGSLSHKQFDARSAV